MKRLRLNIEPAENGGLVIVQMPQPTVAKAAGEQAMYPMYICPKLDPKSIGEVVLSIMAASSLKADPMDIDDIDF